MCGRHGAPGDNAAEGVVEGRCCVCGGVALKMGVLTKIELLMLEWPLAGDCLDVVGDSF